jgi:hypothetical protein
LNQSIEGKTVSGHKLLIRRLKPAQDMKGCQVAFISSSGKNHLHSLFESLKGGGVLTVGETEGFAALGEVINFTMENDKVHFEINLDAAGRAGLNGPLSHGRQFTFCGPFDSPPPTDPSLIEWENVYRV